MRRLPALLAACALLAAGCSGSPAAADDTLVIALPAPPESLNPAQNGSGGQGIVHWLTYEPLIRANSDGTFSAALASDWKYVGPGNTLFEMTIRPDVRFADGTPVDPAAVVATLKYYLSSPGSMKPFLTGISDVTSDGPIVRVHLTAPNPILPYVFSQLVNWGDVISPAGLAQPDQLASKTFGAGAYTLDASATIAGDHYTFVKNTNYYRPEAQRFGKVVVRVVPDPNSAMQALTSGQIDVNLNATATLADQARAGGATVLEGNPGVLALYLVDRAGQTTPALGDVRVRKALNHAVDRSAIAAALGAGYSAVGQIAAAGTDGHDPSLDGTHSYDPEEARRLLASAGYGNGFSFELVDLVTFGMNTASQAVAAQLAKVGVTATIHTDGNDLNRYVADLSSRKFSATTFRLNTPLFASALFNITGAASPLNPFQSTDPDVDRAFTALASASETEQEPAAKAFNRTVVDKAWFLPVAAIQNYVFAKGIDGLGSFAPNGALDVLSWAPQGKA
ncbi:peptide/nickel transport system substrate-binding protein [Saccharothrix tamanrassetensis]|uniref:Peptide/nickel transport system substrate-binding protein n=1 Tax=Saccharothrix tamanrassetensis TaxID=1051531 RepID=A0A841CN20_9PSEU|nr:ABC transporter substrate-binding protein [Saccharothrix tamanrassetensis]MBB5957477.1 peptide/nickel transport system substrate-binding protein [Saccharothrix tamanrassetensis]